MIVTMQDVMAAGYCVRGAKIWFKARGLDFRKFLKDGIDSEIVAGDAMGQRVIEAAKVRHGR